jgi:flavin reductase (DIM6/NTAB) family NADH-FMN oxidoreductase RutF
MGEPGDDVGPALCAGCRAPKSIHVRVYGTVDTFILGAFPEEYRDAMLLLGTKSGRDGDKIRESSPTPIASVQVAVPGFAEAELILECRQIYWADMDAAHFLDPSIEENYPHGDYHRIYFCQIVAIYGSSAYGG